MAARIPKGPQARRSAMSPRFRRARELALLAPVLAALAACYPARLPPPPPPPRLLDEAPSDAAAAVRDESSAPSLAEQVVELALESIGSPYKWGGTDSNGFDCSGLIQFAYGEHGIRLPRVSRAQMRAGASVGLEADGLKPGDVLGFSREAQGKTSHVGLYVGDGEFIHSSTTGVRISDLADPYWQARLVAARRIVP